jgi:hypothetical protein
MDWAPLSDKTADPMKSLCFHVLMALPEAERHDNAVKGGRVRARKKRRICTNKPV